MGVSFGGRSVQQRRWYGFIRTGVCGGFVTKAMRRDTQARLMVIGRLERR